MTQQHLSISVALKSGRLSEMMSLILKSWRSRSMKNGLFLRTCHCHQSPKRKRRERDFQRKAVSKSLMAKQWKKTRMNQTLTSQTRTSKLPLIRQSQRNSLNLSNVFRSSLTSRPNTLKQVSMVNRIFGSSSPLNHQEAEESC